MIKEALFLLILFYFLILLQTSFLVQFNVFGVIPNFILILVIFINLFEKPKSYSGVFAGFVGGLFLDIFSSGIIGFHLLILLGIAIFIKLILRKYVWSPIF